MVNRKNLSFIESEQMEYEGNITTVGLHYWQDGDVLHLFAISKPLSYADLEAEYTITVGDDEYFRGELVGGNSAFKSKHKDEMFRTARRSLMQEMRAAYVRIMDYTRKSASEVRKEELRKEMLGEVVSRGK